MCKFTNRLFVFAVLCVIYHEFCVKAAIARSNKKQKGDDLEDLLDILSPDKDYDLHYDQRQKGEENLRIKMDGFFIGLPESESSDLTVLSEEILGNLGEEALLLGLGKSLSTTTTLPDVYNYNRADPMNENSKADKIIVEIPAPQKDLEPVRRVESKAAEERKAARSKFKIGQLLGFLLRSRKLGSLEQHQKGNIQNYRATI